MLPRQASGPWGTRCQEAMLVAWPPPQGLPEGVKGALPGISPSDLELPTLMPNPTEELGHGNCHLNSADSWKGQGCEQVTW